jgi:genome maintenance exonuclease 1
MKYLPNKFTYAQLKRETHEGSRVYLAAGEKLPSVTTILSATTTEEKKQVLQNWRNRVGHVKAEEITTEAAGRGTSMHKQLENYLLGNEVLVGSNLVHRTAMPMAKTIIDSGLIHLDECWGTEIPLYFPSIYAGTADGAGLWKGKPAIFDFKQTNRPKKSEWIDDYRLQLVAYALAHNEVHGTNIQTGVILMCSRDLEYQEFVLEGNEFKTFVNRWWERVEQYYLLQ